MIAFPWQKLNMVTSFGTTFQEDNAINSKDKIKTVLNTNLMETFMRSTGYTIWRCFKHDIINKMMTKRFNFVIWFSISESH